MKKNCKDLEVFSKYVKEYSVIFQKSYQLSQFINVSEEIK